MYYKSCICLNICYEVKVGLWFIGIYCFFTAKLQVLTVSAPVGWVPGWGAPKTDLRPLRKYSIFWKFGNFTRDLTFWDVIKNTSTSGWLRWVVNRGRLQSSAWWLPSSNSTNQISRFKLRRYGLFMCRDIK